VEGTARRHTPAAPHDECARTRTAGERQPASIYWQQPRTAEILCVVRYQTAGSALPLPSSLPSNPSLLLPRSPGVQDRVRRLDFRIIDRLTSIRPKLHAFPTLIQAQVGGGNKWLKQDERKHRRFGRSLVPLSKFVAAVPRELDKDLLELNWHLATQEALHLTGKNRR